MRSGSKQWLPAAAETPRRRMEQYAMRTRRGEMSVPKTPTHLLRPRPDPTTVERRVQKSRLTDPTDRSFCPEPEQAIVCRVCRGHVTTRDEAMLFLGYHIGSLVVKPPGEMHGIAFFRTAQVRLEYLRYFQQPTSNELDSAHCRICNAQLGLRLITPDFRFYALLLDLISGG